MPGTISRDVPTAFNYLVKTTDGSQPYRYQFTPPEGRPQTNTLEETYPAVVHDARGREHQFSVDVNGFAFVRAPAKEKLFQDEQAIVNGYYQEVIELLKNSVSAKRVIIFDHTIR